MCITISRGEYIAGRTFRCIHNITQLNIVLLIYVLCSERRRRSRPLPTIFNYLSIRLSVCGLSILRL